MKTGSEHIVSRLSSTMRRCTSAQRRPLQASCYSCPHSRGVRNGLQSWDGRQAAARAFNSFPLSFFTYIRRFLSFPFSLFKYISHRQGLVTIYIQTKTHCSLKGQSETSGKLHGVFIFPFLVCHSVFVSKSVCGIFRSKRCFLFRTCRESVDEKLTFTTPDFFGCHCCLGKT